MKEFLMLVREPSFLTPDLTSGAPTPGSFVYPRLDGGSFDMRAVPIMEDLQAGNGVAMLGTRFSDAVEAKGTLRMKLPASQAAFLIGLALQNIDAGRTVPFVTTDPGGNVPVGDLATFSAYYGVKAFDGTVRRRRFGGCRFNSMTLEGTADSPRQVQATFEVEAAKVYGNTSFGGSDADPDDTEFPEPSFADLPNDIFLFSHMSLKLGGAVRPQCYSHSLKFTNKNDPQRYGSKWLQTAQFQGRDSSVESKLLYKTNPGDRAVFEQLASQAVQFVIDNGSVGVTFEFHGNNFIHQVTDDTSLGKSYAQTLSIDNALDAASGTGVSVSFVTH